MSAYNTQNLFKQPKCRVRKQQANPLFILLVIDMSDFPQKTKNCDRVLLAAAG